MENSERPSSDPEQPLQADEVDAVKEGNNPIPSDSEQQPQKVEVKAVEKGDNPEMDKLRIRHWKKVQTIAETLNRNNITSIIELRLDLLKGDETVQEFGHCLDEVVNQITGHARGDWERSKVEAYNKAEAIFYKWVDENSYPDPLKVKR